MKFLKKNAKLIIVGVVLLALVLLYFFTPIKTYATEENIRSFVESAGIFGPLVFIAIYIVASLLFISATVFTIAGGNLFGLFWGWIYAIIAGTTVAGIAFYITRSQVASKKTAKFKNKIVNNLIEQIEKRSETNGFQSIFILRMLYLPFMPLNYAAGLVTKLKFRDYILATLVTNAINSFVFVFLGDQLGKGWQALIIPVVLIALSLLIPKVVKLFVKDEKNTPTPRSSTKR